MMKYKQTRDFMNSLRDLHSKGGSFAKAAGRIKEAIFDALHTPDSDSPLTGLKTTNYGENRIKHCVKYDLTGAARLITTQDNGICLFCFAGDHSACDKWLDKNRGQTPIVNDNGRLTTVQISTNTDDENTRITGQSALIHGFLYEILAEDDFELLIDGLSRKLVREIEQIESVTDESDIYNLVSGIEDNERSVAIYDIFSLLRQSKRDEANKRLDLYLGKSQTLDEMSETEIARLSNSESIQSLSTTDPNFPKIFQRFVETANYMDWMLFMHPDQTDVVDKNFSSSAKLLGVSGSGKTCVVVKRAIRLAEKYPGEDVLILTLNRPLAILIKKMVDVACLEDTRQQIHVKPFFILCQELLQEFEPENTKLYEDKTWKSEGHIHEEHIDNVWREFYRCELNSTDAQVLQPVHDTLISRSVSAEQYIREEFDWIRSAVSPVNRKNYIDIARKGRSHPLDNRFRKLLLKGLSAWEKKMIDVGITDDLGVATALYKYIDRIKPNYRCVLIDEAQDFGTVEFEIIRSLVSEDENDLFFCGDAAQQVSAKHQSFKDADINIHSSRITKITKNYRNSYEILSAAADLLDENLTLEMISSEDFEVLNPQYADFSSPLPLILLADNLENEIAMAISFLNDYISKSKNEKTCLAICGYSLFEIQSFGKRIGLPVLDGSISIDEHNLYLSDLEQTKGFEFDAVCIVNCNDNVLPNPLQPQKEQFRDLSRFYVAMTRAKMQLVISYSGTRSPYLDKEKVKNTFQENNWSHYVHKNQAKKYGIPHSLKEIRKNADIDHESKDLLDMSGPEILYTHNAIGLDGLFIDKLRKLIPGTVTHSTSGQARVKWNCLRDVEEDIAIHPKSRKVFGVEGLNQLKRFLNSINGVKSDDDNFVEESPKDEETLKLKH